MFYLDSQSELQQIPFSLSEAAANCCCNVNNVENPSSQDFHTSSLSTDPESRNHPLFCSRVLHTVKGHSHWGLNAASPPTSWCTFHVFLITTCLTFYLSHFCSCPKRICDSRRATMLLCLFFSFLSVCYKLCMSKVLKVKKPKVCADWSASLLQKTLLVSSPAFIYVTSWHHTTSSCL